MSWQDLTRWPLRSPRNFIVSFAALMALLFISVPGFAAAIFNRVIAPLLVLVFLGLLILYSLRSSAPSKKSK